jgi:hypothetical protein
MAQAVRENSKLTYKVSDVKASKRVLSYFQSKILKARAAGFESTHSQLIQVYSGMDVALRRDLFEPTSMTSLDQYREILMEKEELWMEAYKPRSFTPSPLQRPQPQNRGYTQNYPSRSPTRLSNQNQPVNRPNYAYQQNTPEQQRQSIPCPFHLARRETYYHPAQNCILYK